MTPSTSSTAYPWRWVELHNATYPILEHTTLSSQDLHKRLHDGNLDPREIKKAEAGQVCDMTNSTKVGPSPLLPVPDPPCEDVMTILTSYITVERGVIVCTKQAFAVHAHAYLYRKLTTLKVSRSVVPMRCGLHCVCTLHREETLTST